MTETEAPRIPVLLKTLLGKVHANARELKNPDSFTGIIFYDASKIDHGRPDSYRVILRNAQPVNEADIQRIRALLGVEQKQQEQPPKRAERKRHTQSDGEQQPRRGGRRPRSNRKPKHEQTPASQTDVPPQQAPQPVVEQTAVVEQTPAAQ